MSVPRNAAAALLLAALFTACGEAPQTDADVTAESAPAWIDSVAALADAVEARPAAMDSVLSAHGMSRARLDSLVYEIAKDPALTAAYQEARGR